MPIVSAAASSSGASSSTQPISLHILTSTGTTQANQTAQSCSSLAGNSPAAINTGRPPTPNIIPPAAQLEPLWKRTYNCFKNPKSDAQATTLIITIFVGVLGLLISIASIIVPYVQRRQSVVQGSLGLTQAEINNDYVRLAYCQALPEDRLQQIKWCAHHLTPGAFDDEMRNDTRPRDVVDVSKCSALLSPGRHAALEEHLIASGFRNGSVASVAAIESAVEFLRATHFERDVTSGLEGHRMSSWLGSVRSQMIVVALIPTQWLIRSIDPQFQDKRMTYALEQLLLTCAFHAWALMFGYVILSSLGRALEWLRLIQSLVLLESCMVMLHNIGRIKSHRLSMLNLLFFVAILTFTALTLDELSTWIQLTRVWVPAAGWILTDLAIIRSVLLSYWRPIFVAPTNPHKFPSPSGALQSAADLKITHDLRQSHEAYEGSLGITLQITDDMDLEASTRQRKPEMWQHSIELQTTATDGDYMLILSNPGDWLWEDDHN